MKQTAKKQGLYPDLPGLVILGIGGSLKISYLTIVTLDLNFLRHRTVSQWEIFYEI